MTKRLSHGGGTREAPYSPTDGPVSVKEVEPACGEPFDGAAAWSLVPLRPRRVLGPKPDSAFHEFSDSISSSPQ